MTMIDVWPLVDFRTEAEGDVYHANEGMKLPYETEMDRWRISELVEHGVISLEDPNKSAEK